jgi:hypothetical protein
MALVQPNQFPIKPVVELTDETYTIVGTDEFKMTMAQIVQYIEDELGSQAIQPLAYADYPVETSLNRTFNGKHVFETVITINNLENIRQNPSALPLISIPIETVLEITITHFALAPATIEQTFCYTAKDDINLSPQKQIFVAFDTINEVMGLDFNGTPSFVDGEGVRILVRYTKK